jgi:hypothetical protein
MIHKTLHRKLKNNQHKHHLNLWMNSGTLKEKATQTSLKSVDELRYSERESNTNITQICGWTHVLWKRKQHKYHSNLWMNSGTLKEKATQISLKSVDELRYSERESNTNITQICGWTQVLWKRKQHKHHLNLWMNSGTLNEKATQTSLKSVNELRYSERESGSCNTLTNTTKIMEPIHSTENTTNS